MLKPPKPRLDVRERAEIVRCQRLALKNREVELDLVEPTGVKGTVNGDDVGKQGLEALDAGGASMRGPVVENPEDASGLAIRGLGHNLGDQALERLNAGRVLTAAEQLRAVHVQRREIGPGAAALVLVLHAQGLARLRRSRGMTAEPCLDARLFVGRNDKLIGRQGAAVVLTGVEIENPPRLNGKVVIAREDPGAVLSWPNRIFVQPPPDGLVADPGDDASPLRLAHDIRGTQPRERQAARRRQLTRERFNLDDEFWGEKPGADPGGGVPQGRPGVAGRIACARD